MNRHKIKNYETAEPEKRMTAKGRLYLTAFFLPVLICIIICMKNEVYPFGDNCILHIDMYHQYEPFFTELMEKLKNGGSLLYSWRIGLGSDFISLFAYYLASPVNWLLLLCPSGNVIEFMTIIVISKIGLCSLTFTYFLNRRFQTEEIGAAVFGMFYALSGYLAAYSWNVMWLDCILLAPLILAGLLKLVKEKRCGLYCLTLAICVLSNFYISIMICIFLVLYFLILCFEEWHTLKERAKCCLRFFWYSLLGGGMGAILIIPEAITLSYSGSANFGFPEKMEHYFHLLAELARHCTNTDVYTGRDHWPNLYCGAAVLLFFFLYLLNKKISWKNKIPRVLLLVFFWISFSNNYLDYIWHGFHFPDSLPGRQSFLYILLLLAIAFETYQSREGNTKNHYFISLSLAILFLAGAYYVTDKALVERGAFILTAVLLLGYAVLFLLLRLGVSKQQKKTALVLLFALAVLEAYSNFQLTGLSATSRTAYTKNWESVKGLLAEVEEEEEEFYRMEETERLTKNDAAIYGYPSATIFSSLMNINIGNLYRKVGMEGGKNFYSYSGATPLMSAMLSVKYLISQSPYEDSPLSTMVTSDGKSYIYRNTYCLPLGFAMAQGVESQWDPQYGRPVENLNRLAGLLGAEEDMLLPFSGEVKEQSKETTITVTEDSYLYATYTDKTVTNVTVKKGPRVRKFSKCDHGYILDLGWVKAGETLTITTNAGKKFPVTPYRLNIRAVDQSFSALNQETMKLDSYSDTRITGHISLEEARDLILAIPKEEGWSVKVDGKQTQALAFMDSFLRVPLSAGKHTIELNYMTPGLFEGAAVSGACFALFLLPYAVKAAGRKINTGREDNGENKSCNSMLQ